MADKGGTEDDAVTFDEGHEGKIDAAAMVGAQPRHWEFFAAVRALQAARGSQPPVGRSTRIEQDFLRFKQKPSLAFEPSEIISFAETAGQNRPEWTLKQAFFGMFGPNGPLPIHITEDAIIDQSAQDAGLLPEFCDLLQHRFTALLYRGWEATQLAASRDLGQTDPFKRYTNALFGAAPQEFRDRSVLSDDTKRFMSGWMSSKHGSVAAVEAVTEIITGHPARVQQFVGEWLPIPEDQQTRFPARGAKAMAGPRLGVDTVIGASAFTAQNRIVIETARLDYPAYDQLMPGGETFEQLRGGMRHILGLSTAWELKPILKVGEIPELKLDGGRRLGWDTWLDTANRTRDGDEFTTDGTLKQTESQAA